MKERDPHAVEQRAIDAEALGSRWLGNANVETDPVRRAKYFSKAQFWLDRANLLRGNTDKPAPQR